jgi:hypothetical protein
MGSTGAPRLVRLASPRRVGGILISKSNDISEISTMPPLPFCGLSVRDSQAERAAAASWPLLPWYVWPSLLE